MAYAVTAVYTTDSYLSGWRLAHACGAMHLPLALLAVVALVGTALRYARRARTLVLLFDGLGWFNSNGERASVDRVYASAGLLAARVDVAGRRYHLLLCAGQCSREQWRRLRLGLGVA